VQCPDHGVVVAFVPWARPGAKCTYTLEDTCAWLAAHTALSVLTVLLRLSWRTVAGIVARVVADLAGKTDRLDGLSRIGIDEISYRKGHRYLTVVVDHDTGRMVWAHEGRNRETVEMFFTELGPDRAGLLTHVSADGAEWIHTVVADRAPNAVLCLDPFHVVAWAMKALDTVRVRTVAAAAGVRDRHLMWAVRRNPEDLNVGQRTTLAGLEQVNGELYRAYLLKEQLREVFRVKGVRGHELLAGWIGWARDCGIAEFEKLCRTIERYRSLIRNTLDHNVTNARSEATNTHIRGLTKRAYGYHSPEALIGMVMLTRGGLCPSLPGRK
jgi:transposase